MPRCRVAPIFIEIHTGYVNSNNNNNVEPRERAILGTELFPTAAKLPLDADPGWRRVQRELLDG